MGGFRKVTPQNRSTPWACRVQGDLVTHDPVPTRAPRGRALADIGPIEQLRAGRLGVRLPLLLAGLFLYGASMAMVLRAPSARSRGTCCTSASRTTSR